VNLTILRASSNQISEITEPFPDSLAILTLADNLLSDLEFMETCLPQEKLEFLDVSGNNITTLLSLRYIPLYNHLRVLKVGLCDRMRDLPVIQFAKFMCESLESFDDEGLGDVDAEFPVDEMTDQLTQGTEESLREFLVEAARRYGPSIQWKEPVFVEFMEDVTAPIAALEERVRGIEERLPAKKRRGTEDAEIGALRADVRELKEQVAQIARLLFVHDRALGQIWEEGGQTKGESF
jgi:hypothetical protein